MAILLVSCEQRDEEIIIAEKTTHFVVNALRLDNYSTLNAQTFLTKNKASLKKYWKREPDPKNRNIKNDRDMFSFTANISENASIIGECWERSVPDQMKSIDRLLPKAGKLTDALTTLKKQEYGQAVKMRNCDILLRLTNSVDRERLDREFAAIFKSEYASNTIRRTISGIDFGGKIEEPILDEPGTIIHLGFRTKTKASASFNGIKAFYE